MAKLKQSDINRSVREKVEEEYLQNVEKRVLKVQDEYYTKPDTIMEICPYCSPDTSVEYYNTRIFKTIRNRKYIVLTCPKCNKTVFCNIHVREMGDMLSGFSYEAEVLMFKPEDLGETTKIHVLGTKPAESPELE